MRWYEDPIYIKMCETSEIRYAWKFSVGDYAVDTKHRVVWLISGRGKGFWKLEPVTCASDYQMTCMDNGASDILFPLPRQDQLQEMYGGFGDCLAAIYWWQEAGRLGDYYGYSLSDFTSMEQLLIALVMEKRSSKVWAWTDWADA